MANTIPSGFRSIPLSIAQLSLAVVLKSGQSFRWTALPLTTAKDAHAEATNLNVEYRLALKDRIICLRQTSDTLLYRAVFPVPPSDPTTCMADLERVREAETLAWLQDYFQLDVDLIKLYDTWEEVDPVFGKLRSRFTGIRMLRQDPWENLVSFICSQNNHITRITSMVQSLCTHFSPTLLSIPHPNSTLSSPENSQEYFLAYHAFPSASSLASSDTSTVLRSLGFGYRAEYIQRTAQMLVEAHGEQGAEHFLTSLRQKSTDEAREELLTFMGVGRKVADCVLLMSLDKHEVVPVDTHVHQIAMKHYGLRGVGSGSKAAMTPKLYDEVQTKLGGIWGDRAGWAHSVLFTADLKSFSTYGLSTPSPSVSPERTRKKLKLKSSADLTSLPVRPAKRKHNMEKLETEMVNEKTAALVHKDDHGGLADRVKRRRRGVYIGGYVESAPA